MQSFVERRLERVDGATVAAGDLWRLWKRDCESLGIDPGTQQAFGRTAKKWFINHEKNNGRPRYCHVKLRADHANSVERTHGPLRLAVVNS